MKAWCNFTFFGEKWACHRKDIPGDEGGVASHELKKVVIDRRYGHDDFRSYLHHELLEIAMYCAGCGYDRTYPDNASRFVLDHNLMSLVSQNVRSAYDEVVNKMR